MRCATAWVCPGVPTRMHLDLDNAQWHRNAVGTMRKVAAIVLLLCFTALGTGLVDHLHNLDHAREDARLAAAAEAAGLPAPKPVQHDDSNCDIHAQLHLPLLAVAWVPLLICLGLLVAFLTEIATQLVSQRLPLCLDCRGPPAC
jgi:hypothetical protein